MSDSTRSLEIARRMANLGRVEDAARAYTLALENGIEGDPEAELEAAVCALQFGKDYKLPYKVFHSLYSQGLFREETFNIMTGAFYEPNLKDLQSRYEQNCKMLSKYSYFFRKDFVPFSELPIRFYPYDDYQYIPYYPAEKRFGELIDFKEPVIKHYFFKNLDDPILAEDIFSQYELEYLNDNVRKSEYVARENHIYLHYTDWAVFCAYLQCWNLNSLLDDEKFVFLMEDEISQYPIDFKARFGIDYSQYKVKPIGIREVNRLIWHTQLSSHNGGDFFNEIFDAHPNLIVMPSLMLSKVEAVLDEGWTNLESWGSQRDAVKNRGEWSPETVTELYLMKGRTRKDILVGIFLNDKRAAAGLDRNSRIAPALFFQPHFPNIVYGIRIDKKGRSILLSDEYDRIRQSQIFKNFKYIKTFTPLRRITTSYGASIRFGLEHKSNKTAREDGKYRVINDIVFERSTNRSFMVDARDRLFQDSRLVRFEDGKLNPKATFTALAEFLDLPYTESLTYCSQYGKREFNVEGNVDGFDPATVYRTYDNYANDAERTLLEYFLQDVYAEYGYDFHYYDGGEMDKDRIGELIQGCTLLNGLIRRTYRPYFTDKIKDGKLESRGSTLEESVEMELNQMMEDMDKERLRVAQILMKGLRFVNLKGQPLQFMKKLELDPALLEQPLYH